jgi:hypothetical protein
MATETSRQISVRRITAPGDESSYVDLKVIDKIMFVDPRQQYQEWELSFANNLDAGRKVRVVEVGESKLKVERIDALSSVHDTGGRYQGWETTYENGDDPPIHYKTHKKKIYALNKDKTKNTSVWIEVQRVDAIWFKDPKENYQERVWELVWPDLENEEWDYEDLPAPTKDWDKTTINPPWRLDPFQTIVGCSFDSGHMLVIFNSGGANKIASIPMSELNSLGSKTYTSRSIGWSRGARQYYGVAQLKAASDLHVAATYISIASDGTVSDSGSLNYYNVKKTILGPSATSPTSSVTTKRPLINFTGRVFYDNLGNKTDFTTESVTCTVERSWIIDADAVAAVDKSGVLWGYSQAFATGRLYINYRKYYFADAHWDVYNSLYVGPNGLSGGTAGPDQSNDFTIGDPTISAVTIPLNQRVMVYSNDGSLDNVTLSVSSGSYILDETVNSLASSTYLGLESTSNLIYSAGWTYIGPQRIFFSGSYESGTTAGSAVSWSFENYPGGVYGPDLVYAPSDTYEDLYPEVGTYTFAANGKTSIKVIDATTLYFVNNSIVIKDGVDVTSALFSAIGASTTDWIHAIFLDVKKADVDKLK